MKAAQRMNVNIVIGTHSCPSQQSPRPRCLFTRNTPECHCDFFLHVETHDSGQHLSRLPSPEGTTTQFLYLQQLFLPPHPTTHLVCGLNMTFRRLKKVNSSGPESGPTSQDGDIYFPSSKSDSCRTVELPSNSSEVYNYKTLAYSGGTLPRNSKKVRS